MKPVPFAEYLARHKAAPAPAPESKPSWPPPRQHTPDEKPASLSPLLRKTEVQRVQALREVREDEARAAPKLEQSLLKAFEDGRAAMRREWDEERARLKEEIAEQVAREREHWAQTEGERLLAAHRAAMTEFETRCAQAVANILRPFLTQAVIARVTESLVQNIEVLITSRRRAMFEISGPQDLIEALKQKFSDRPASITYSLTDGVDVRVRVDETIIETQLGAWMQALGALSSDAPEASEERPAARRRTRTKSAPSQESAE
jgi:Skp family chaperone for outer membrane proteins